MKAKLLDKWSISYEFCIDCKTREHCHQANGLCTSCFGKRRRNLPKKDRNLWDTIHFFCEKCKISIDTGIALKEIDDNLSILQIKQEQHQFFNH